MALFITSLNSGSNGNCYYIGNEKEAVLIDAGISCRETEKRMKRLGLDMSLVKAIFVSHEHSDHITGIPGLCKKFQLPVYVTPATLQAAAIPVEKHLVQHFLPQQPVTIGDLTITGFPKCHDACDPHSFVVTNNKVKVGVFTDIGNSCTHVIHHFSQCHSVFLEANYCGDMLANGSYPYYLKKRISGGNGHLSNMQALELFTQYRGNHLTHLILSHLSKNNNSPELVAELFNKEANGTTIIVASRYHETPVYCIADTVDLPVAAKTKASAKHTQLSLF
ncbi:MBL fold metallo-hydrolase [Agriterribacter sp.]|uniref:MBL fold metallo-hydrolase n=1 Tax=Agriterribacter sp. TaxID=2821509 RepID=UPI002BDCB1D0|nr:MBL fold metallo-hydrolase [Agriterribacter sp.]HRO46831.1 MBL fold metallo-hydrolase [Agriterribacter sp.]HRQ15560.1 MBL fold metallo-hydrolase [Agriterribacter sp.]